MKIFYEVEIRTQRKESLDSHIVTRFEIEPIATAENKRAENFHMELIGWILIIPYYPLTQAEQKPDFTGILFISKLNKSQTLRGFIDH